MGISKRFASEEYVTESINLVEQRVETLETENKQLQEQIADYLPKNQGSSNVGKILVVGADGNLTLTDMPTGIITT